MNSGMNPLIFLLLLPLLGTAVLWLIPSDRKGAIRWTALITSLVAFVVSLWMLAQFNRADPNLQMVCQLCLAGIRESLSEFPHRCGWTEYFDDPVDHIPDPDFNPIHLDSRAG